MSEKWKVHKFGGTSVLNADRFRNVYKILTGPARSEFQAIVVSAMKGTTDDLIRCVEMAKEQNENYKSLIGKIEERHCKEISDLLDKDRAQSLNQIIKADIDELLQILRGVWLVKNASDRVVDMVSGMGEVWSAQILSAYFQSQGCACPWLDARKVLVVNHAEQRVVVDWKTSKTRFANWMNDNPAKVVAITGFVAATEDGTITTLGRNGSDFSGSIFGALFDCDEVFIWTDVDGVLSADPRLVPEAVILSEMSYSEVTELAYFGAKVVHPATMAPVIAKKIPIWIKNTFNPSGSGTKIFQDAKSDRPVKGFSIIDKMSLVNIEGTGMVGVPGVAERLFGSLRSAGVSVVLISQASSEQSICFSIPENQENRAKAAAEQAFFAEIQQGLINTIQITKNVSILAAVGDNMVHSPGVAGKFFTALGRSGVNIRAIAQGSSERNISAVIDSKDAIKALRTVHSSFILPQQVISVGLIGPGLIGGAFLRQLNEQLHELKNKRSIEIQIRAISDSKKMILSESAIDLNSWQEILSNNSEPVDLDKFSQHIKSSHIPHCAIIEASASSKLTPFYHQWLEQGIHIISPNKKANTGTMFEYRQIRDAAKKSNKHFLYSTNVGAGLPIIQTLKDLSATGDEILMIQGILSGTLSFIFSQYNESTAFSKIVTTAKDLGFTEPDPREDLSGQDVARKFVILARELGISIEIDEVQVESLVPKNLQNIPLAEFMSRISELDAPMLSRLKSAKATGQILRFVGTIEKNGKAKVALENLPSNHSFANLTGTDNIVLFKTKRYFNQPLVIQGPGAGPEVTAAGVFADLLRLSQYLGATP